MAQLVQENWYLLLAALVIGVAVAWWIFAANRKTKVQHTPKDEGDAVAKRNQALIDAPAASVKEETPAPSPTASTPAIPASTSDDLSLIKGLGPKLRTQLAEMGITSFAQIAAWDDAEIDRVDAQLGRFQGRIRRDNWVEQARLLASGDSSAYEEQFGRT
jgi:predicted flap endonuclease-1-like 5' DNA nuclease